MNEYSKTINETQILVHKLQWDLEQMQYNNQKLIELSEQMTELCDKFLRDTEDK